MSGAASTAPVGVTGRLTDLSAAQLARLLERGASPDPEVERATAAAIADVRARGDAALLDLARRYDAAVPQRLEVPREACRHALAELAAALRAALEEAAANVRAFHAAQLPDELEVEVRPGVRLGRRPEPLARVGVVYSQQTAANYGGPDAHAKVEDPIRGVYQALIEARIPFEMVHDRLMDAAHLSRLRTLVLPNVAALSDAQCDDLRAFVAAGGSLVATYETSRYDEHGTPRRNLGLADLFGVDAIGAPRGPIKNAYLHVEPDASIAPTMLAGMEDAQRLIYGGYELPVRARPGVNFAPAPITVVPSYPDLPMEEVYPRMPHTAIPGVYCRKVGAGRIAYLPWDLARIFWEVLNIDHGKLLSNAVRWVTDEPAPVTVEGPGVLDVTAWRGPGAITVHLVNLTNPMMMRGAFRELWPVGPQRVTIPLPAGAQVERVHLLVASTTPDVRVMDDRLGITVPTVVDHEVVAIDLAG